jgi:hypothetical protein
VQTIKSYHYNYQKHPEKVAVVVSLENTSDNNLGIPLPGGRARIYKKEDDQLLILGEDLIQDTPKGETIRLEVGKVFDIQAKRTVLEQRREGKNSEKMKIAVELRNHKDQDTEIIVTEPLLRHRNAKILNSNFKVQHQTADKIEFLIPVKSGQSESLNLELLYTW